MRLLKYALLVGAAAFSSCVLASTVLTVTLEGPGGHSNGSYGNTNAVHAASQAVMNIHKAVPDAVITDMKGGSTVNAIAAEASFNVKLSGDEAKIAQAKETVKKAVEEGCAKENAFRGVSPGQVVDGLRVDIRCSVK